MTEANSSRARPPRGPHRQDERPGWGVWVLVGVCILLGAALVVALRGRMARMGVPPETASAPEARQATAPAAGPAGGSTPPRPVGEGQVTRSPQQGLHVLWAKPSGTIPVFPNAVIEVRFSAPMDPAAVQSSFTISPSVAGTFEWSRPDEMHFRPGRLLEMGAEYKVALSDFAHDARRNEYLVPHAWTLAVLKTYTFRHNVGRVIRHGCGACHRAGGTAGRAPLGSYPEVMRYVQKGNATASSLVTALSNPRTHGQVPPDWQAMYFVIRDWIDKFDAAE